MPTLHEMTADVRQMLDQLLEMGFSDEEAVEAVTEYAESNEDLVTKLDNMGKLRAELRMYEDHWRKEAARLRAMAVAAERRCKRLEQYIINCMTAAGLRKVATPRFLFSTRQAGGLRPLIIHIPPEELPEQYIKYEIKPDIEAIRRALEAGETILGAELGERQTVLRVSQEGASELP